MQEERSSISDYSEYNAHTTGILPHGGSYFKIPFHVSELSVHCKSIRTVFTVIKHRPSIKPNKRWRLTYLYMHPYPENLTSFLNSGHFTSECMGLFGYAMH